LKKGSSDGGGPLCHCVTSPRTAGNVIKLRKNKIVTGIRNEPVTIFMNIETLIIFTAQEIS